MQDNMVRSTSSIGWLLLIGGIVIGGGVAIFEWVNTPDVPLLVKLIVGAIYLGLAFLLISVLRQRLIERKTDKYKDVEILMLVVTSEAIGGKRIVRSLGMVRGNTVRARNVGKDIKATFRALVGGEISEYVKLMAEAREQSVDRMIEAAEQLGANAVVATRFTTSMVMQGAAELLATGTAVIVEDE